MLVLHGDMHILYNITSILISLHVKTALEIYKSNKNY